MICEHLHFTSSLSSLFFPTPPHPSAIVKLSLAFYCSCKKRAAIAMSSIIHTFQKTKSLPVSRPESKSEQLPAQPAAAGLRRRLSSLSLKIQEATTSSPATSWAFHRSKSLSSMGEYAGSSIRKWWDWGCSWVLSRKPVFAKDLEMDDDETRILGCHSKGSWRHVFYKVKSEIKKMVGSNKVGLPQTCRYSSLDYSKNFDDGNRI